MRAKKRFGQNFLHDRHVIHQIVSAIAPKRDDVIVEIGPGQGALTFPLLDRVDTLHVIEIDRDLIAPLLQRAESQKNLQVHEGDALSIDFSKFIKNQQKIRVVGNLPYNISTPLLFHFLEYAPLIEDITVMLQQEVVHRLSAVPGTKDYGRLSVMIQYQCAVTALFAVPPESFNPAPQVMSQIVVLKPYDTLPVIADNYQVFSAVVKQAFQQRRKTLRNTLKGLLPLPAFEKCGVESASTSRDLISRNLCEN